MSGWIDAHTHLDMDPFAADRADVVARAHDAGVDGFVVAGAAPADWDRVEAVGRATGAAWTLGVHPWWLADLDEAALAAALADLEARPTPHGIGETGLDHARARTPEDRRRQRDVLRAHLALARDRDVPVVLHVVRATPQALRVIADDGLPAAGGMIHAWSGPAEHVPWSVDLGLHLSFGAAVVRNRHAAEAAAACPDDRLLLETDAPDQPLHPGERGEPADLPGIAAYVATLRGTTAEHVLDTAARNARRLFPVLARPSG